MSIINESHENHGQWSCFTSGMFAVNLQGRLVDRLDVDIKVQGFHHDMFITENYMVLVDGSTRFTPDGVVKGQPLWNFDQAGYALIIGIPCV